MTFVEELVPHLPEWLGRQRWFGAKGREVSAVEVTSATAMTVVVNDLNAVYPLRIDPTFSDANWLSMGGIPGGI